MRRHELNKLNCDQQIVFPYSLFDQNEEEKRTASISQSIPWKRKKIQTLLNQMLVSRVYFSFDRISMKMQTFFWEFIWQFDFSLFVISLKRITLFYGVVLKSVKILKWLVMQMEDKKVNEKIAENIHRNDIMK